MAQITEAKKRFITNIRAKLDKYETASKIYCSIINKFLNDKNIPIIPPIVNGKLILTPRKKISLFNNHFVPQCTPVRNASRLANFKYKTDESLTFIEISEFDKLDMKNLKCMAEMIC